MSNALTVLNTNTAIQDGGLGVDFGNKLFKLKPANIFIVQNNSTIEGAVKGNLRIAETGDQYESIWATLLVMPTEQRQYHIGLPGEMNRTPENLMCFSSDMVVPHPKARIPQAINCASCARADWGPWREYKEANNGQSNKALIPPCDAHYRMLLIDDKYKLPLQMFIRSDAKGPFEDGMQNLARVLYAQEVDTGKKPNIFDVRFKISTKIKTKGKYTYYTPVFSDFKPVTEEQKQQFGSVYLKYTSQKAKQQEQDAQEEVEAEIATTQNDINSAVTDGEYVGEDKEIII